MNFATYSTQSWLMCQNTRSRIVCILQSRVFQTNSIGLNSGDHAGNHRIMIANLSHSLSSRTVLSFPTWFGALSSTIMAPGIKILHGNCPLISHAKNYCSVCSIMNPKPDRIWLFIDSTKSTYFVCDSKIRIRNNVGNFSSSGFCCTSQLKQSIPLKLI